MGQEQKRRGMVTGLEYKYNCSRCAGNVNLKALFTLKAFKFRDLRFIGNVLLRLLRTELDDDRKGEGFSRSLVLTRCRCFRNV
ncbi:hypothetical protein U1Q18_049369 [Sarracenia purpurea var. burkii]